MPGETIPNKRVMYDLFNRGRFGNAGINFRTVEEAEAYPGQVVIRVRRDTVLNGARTEFFIPAPEIRQRVAQWEARGFRRDELQLSAQMPEHEIVMQGEVMRSERYWDLLYDCEPGLDMKSAMRRAEYATGVKAHGLLRHAFQGSDWEDLMELFDSYPDSVIEFSAYRVPVGNLRRHVVIWEVRNY